MDMCNFDSQPPPSPPEFQKSPCSHTDPIAGRTRPTHVVALRETSRHRGYADVVRDDDFEYVCFLVVEIDE